MVLKNQVVPGTVNAAPHDFEAAIADLDIGFQRWPEALHALLSARTPIDKAVACLPAWTISRPQKRHYPHLNTNQSSSLTDSHRTLWITCQGG
ncbi:MAG TPA: hypothetical protein VHD63_27315 [Ktedonobacteraceae bacterium]|nr:hypothetical protein [Ktedonobacteraceae bacterium]